MTDYTKLGTEIGDLVTQKNKAYGSSFAKAGDFLRLLWPNGIPPGREDDALLLVRIFDKQMRVATDNDPDGESPYRDIAGYGLLGAALHEKRNAPCGSASADAEDEPKAQPASQPQNAPEPTTTNADAPTPPNSSGGCFPRPAFSSLNAALQDAFARAATVSAPSGEEDRLGVRLPAFDYFPPCTWCGRALDGLIVRDSLGCQFCCGQHAAALKAAAL